jgi:D-alanyl-D-alanine dipeptidase
MVPDSSSDSPLVIVHSDAKPALEELTNDGIGYDELYATKKTWLGYAMYKPNPPLLVLPAMKVALEATLASLREIDKELEVYVVAAHRAVEVQEALYKKDPSVGQTSPHCTGAAVAICLAKNGIPLFPIKDIINEFFAAGPKRQLSDLPKFQDAINNHKEEIDLLRECAERAGLLINPDKFWHFELPNAQNLPIMLLEDAKQYLIQSR